MSQRPLRGCSAARRVHRAGCAVLVGAPRGASARRKPGAMRTAPDVDDMYQAHLSRGLSRAYRLLGLGSEVRTEGPWVWSSTGKCYLDFGGFGVFLLGHRHPYVVSAVQNCLEQIGLSSRAMANPFTARAAEALARST